MRSRSNFIHHRTALALSALGGNVAPVRITWQEWPPESTVDPVDGSHSGTPVERSETVRALVHYVQPASAALRQFAEVQVGDAVVDFQSTLDLSGREAVRFQIADQGWVQAKTGQALAESWDTLVGGRRQVRSLLLRQAT